MLGGGFGKDLDENLMNIWMYLEAISERWSLNVNDRYIYICISLVSLISSKYVYVYIYISVRVFGYINIYVYYVYL